MDSMLNNKILAKHLYKLGLNITCITNYVTEYNFYDANILKGAYHEWKHLKKSRQLIGELIEYDWDNSVGLGTIAGFENLHVLDIDGCTNYNFIEDLLIILGLPKHYEWVVKTGSLDGYHIYFYSELLETLEEDQVTSSYPPNLDNTGLFEKIELLWNTHIVLPNSIHKSGSKYSFTNCKFPKKKPVFIDINKFKIIESLFLNILEIERKKVYFSLSKEKHRNIRLPNKDINLIDLSLIDENLFFLFDIETDGLIINNNYPKIVQISWMIMDTKGIVYKKATELVNSNFNEKSKAFKIHKLNADIIKKIGKKPSEVFLDITYDLKHCKFITAHNLKFDLSILENEFENHQIDFNFNNLTQFCTMKFGTKLLNKRNAVVKNPKMIELYEHLFNHKVKQFHNANSDVTILAKCVKELLYKGKIDHLKNL